MRTLAITQNITVDGSIELLDDWFDPSDQDAELLAEIHRQSAEEEILLLGRQTFEDLRSYWPNQADDRTGIAAHLDRVAKYVVSSTLTEPGWVNTTVLGADWLDRVTALKQGDGGDVVVTGSISLCAGLIAARVVDEYRLFVHPVTQGRGRRLFPDDRHAQRLTLRQARAFPSGVALLTYAASRTGAGSS
jgi:dihydrofolate reductase